MFNKTILNTSMALATVIALSACGGGGGGGSSDPENNDQTNNGDTGNNGNNGSNFSTTVPEESLLLTRENAYDVSLHIARLVLDVEDLTSAINISVIDNANRNKSAYVKPLNTGGSQYQNRRLSTLGVCESGSVSMGSGMVSRFNDCEYSNTLYNGEVDLDLVFSGTPSVGGDFAYAGDGVANNFTLTQGSRVVRIDGEFDINNGSIEDTEIPGGTSMTIDGVVNDKPLYLNEAGETTRLAGNYSLNFTTDTETTTPITYSQDIDGRVASTALGGQVTVLSQNFTGFDNNFPHSGTLTVVGAAQSVIELEVIDDSTVQVSVDANGDDDFDDFEDGQEIMTWIQFLQL